MKIKPTFNNDDLQTQLKLMGAGDTIACSERLTSSNEAGQPGHTRRGLYDHDEALWLGHAGAANVAAPRFKA